MTPVVHLKWGERPPGEDMYLLVTRQGRVRGDDYYVRASDHPNAPPLLGLGPEGPGFASLDSALRLAETVAVRNGVTAIYVKLQGPSAEVPFAA